jgi:transcriptional regulator with XRE-family HTH domain
MNTFTKSLSKIEVAELLGVSASTLRNWLNKRYFEELKAYDYDPNQKILTPKQLNYLAAKIDLTPKVQPNSIKTHKNQ